MAMPSGEAQQSRGHQQIETSAVDIVELSEGLFQVAW
jgi:hypothetical protein